VFERTVLGFAFVSRGVFFREVFRESFGAFREGFGFVRVLVLSFDSVVSFVLSFFRGIRSVRLWYFLNVVGLLVEIDARGVNMFFFIPVNLNSNQFRRGCLFY
jgi:hypothetical protein